MTDQLILKFPNKDIYLKEDFYVSQSNQKAYRTSGPPAWMSTKVGAGSADQTPPSRSVLAPLES